MIFFESSVLKEKNKWLCVGIKAVKLNETRVEKMSVWETTPFSLQALISGAASEFYDF